MAFEGGIDLGMILIISLAVVATIIATLIFIRPSIDGGPLTYLASAVSWLLKPVVP
jgi:hypothetical protein